MKEELDIRESMNQISDQGWLALGNSDFIQAEKCYAQALELALGLKDVLSESIFTSYLAVAKRALGKPEDARKLLLHALALGEDLNELRVVAHISFLLAELDIADGDEAQAIAGLWKALDAALETDELGTIEAAFGSLGEIYRNRGWLEQSSECFRQALETAPDGDNAVAWLGNLGQTLSEMGDFSAARNCYEQALFRAEEQGDLKLQSRCLASEGLAFFEEKKYAQSFSCMAKALEMARSTQDRVAQSAWLGNLGNIFLRMGKPEEARKYCKEALELARSEKDLRLESAHLDSIGDCLAEEGDYNQALEHYGQALFGAREICDRLAETVYLTNQGKALCKIGKDEESLSCFKQAAELFEEQRGRIQSDSLKTAFTAARQDIYRNLIELCLKSGRRVEAIEYVGRAKSRAMLDLLGNSPIDIAELELADDASVARLILKEIELRSQISGLERMFGKSIASDADSRHRSAVATVEDVPKLYKEWRSVVDQLKRRHPAYASMVAVDSIGFEEMRSLWKSQGGNLSSSAAIIEFYWSDSFLLTAAVWDGMQEPEIRVLAGDEFSELDRDLADLLEMSSTEGWEVPRSLCQRLFSRLMGFKLPEGTEHLLLIPHGHLYKLPFAALHDGTGYLIEKYELSVLPAASLIKLLAPGKNKREDVSYLVSAISDYSATRADGAAFSSGLRSASGLEDLNYTLEEGQTIYGLAAAIAGNAKLLTNDEVKDGLLDNFRDYSVIHFAGHAIFNYEEPLASGLVLADGSVLTAARILEDSKFRTKSGQLLVLSACQTGVNVITGGGEIYGLARALIYAGMRNLISSLWEVADRSTACLMEDFHRCWQGGQLPISRALKEAQCKAIAQGQPVHAWAPFIHMGID